ncbi:MAG: biopolymer transporter ExbD [Lentisphaeria bacterium]|nr:biopolymer transporter ExbD [Lentisphaeria bacterium]NQZ67138.1 biopolymer transporter ExbD [Lentisphaeria bacterium]
MKERLFTIIFCLLALGVSADTDKKPKPRAILLSSIIKDLAELEIKNVEINATTLPELMKQLGNGVKPFGEKHPDFAVIIDSSGPKFKVVFKADRIHFIDLLNIVCHQAKLMWSIGPGGLVIRPQVVYNDRIITEDDERSLPDEGDELSLPDEGDEIVKEEKNKPKQKAFGKRSAKDPIVVNVFEKGKMLVMGKAISEKQLLTMLKKAKKEYSKVSVIIRGDKKANWKNIATVMNACSGAGIDRVSSTVEVDAEDK